MGSFAKAEGVSLQAAACSALRCPPVHARIAGLPWLSRQAWISSSCVRAAVKDGKLN